MNQKNFNAADLNSHQNIILFDGVCNLCDHAVNFIIDRDPTDRFVFASLQSETGRLLLKKFNLDEEYRDSLVLIHSNNAYRKSTAALLIARGLTGFWPAFYVFRLVPTFIRDFFYDIVARFRYRWFGKRSSCRIPTPELKAKFL